MKRVLTFLAILVLCVVAVLGIAAPRSTYVQAEGETFTIHVNDGSIKDHGCDSTEWHFIINQISDPTLAPESIHVEWVNGNTATVKFHKVTDGGAAHYSTKANLDSTVKDAWTSIYVGWGGNFNLSHGPCDTPTATPTNTYTNTPTDTATSTFTYTPTDTETPTPTEETPTPTEGTATVTHTSTMTKTSTATVTGTPPTTTPTKNTITPTPTEEKQKSPTPTATEKKPGGSAPTSNGSIVSVALMLFTMLGGLIFFVRKILLAKKM